MKRIIRTLVILALTVIAHPVYAAPTAQTPCLVGPAVNVREGPGAGYRRTGVLNRGECITVLAVSPDGQWYQTPQGWVWAAPHLWTDGGLPAAPAAGLSQPVAPAASGHVVAVETWVSNTAPAPFDEVAAYALISIDGLPRAGIPVEFAWLLPGGPSACAGVTDGNGLAGCVQNIGAAPAGQVVQVRASFRAYGRNYVFVRSYAAHGNCDPAYPDFCLLPATSILACRDIPYRAFVVRPPDTHGFDPDGNGVGCEV